MVATCTELSSIDMIADRSRGLLIIKLILPAAPGAIT
jgi:hypothetical protein